MRLVLVLLAAALLAPTLVAAPATDPLPRASPAYDADGNRVFDDLDRRLDGLAADARVDVIVVFAVPSLEKGLAGLRQAVGDVPLAFEYPTLPGAALTLSRADILRLARADVVRQIELDVEATPELATSTTYFGARAVWNDLGVTGDMDGNPDVFTKDDATIAVLDTGIHAAHLDFSGGKIIAWKDMVSGTTSPVDTGGHGTHVASIAAGRGIADPDMRGVAPGASLVGVRISTKSNTAAGVEWVIANKDVYGIDVMTNSFGFGIGRDGTDSLSMLFDAAFDAGLVTVKSTGNSGPEYGTMTIPGDARNVLAVGSLVDPGKSGWKLATYSSRGPTTDGRVKPDVSAPGDSISAARAGTTNGYIAYSGTSMAAPHVAGVAALVKAANPALTNVDIRRIIVETAEDRGFPGPDNDYGNGVVDAYAAVKRARGETGRNPVTTPSVVRLSDTFASPDAWLLDIADGAHPVSVTVLTNATGAARDFDVVFRQLTPTPLNTYTHSQDGKRHANFNVDAGAGTWLVLVRGTGGATYSLDVSAPYPAAPASWHGLKVPEGLVPA